MAGLNFSREVTDLSALKNVWKDVLPQLTPRTILLLNGEVGAGKTTSVQMIAEILGLKNVQSPSFAIHLRYENDQGQAMDHLDIYRLKDDDDLESSGFWDIFAQDSGLVVIEWAQRLDYQFLPLNWSRIEVKFQTSPNGQRWIHFQELLD